MVRKNSWQEFRQTGLLWWINMILHTFGWAIVFDVDGDNVVDVYPARVSFRGFSEDINDIGYKRVSDWMVDAAEALKKEAEM